MESQLDGATSTRPLAVRAALAAGNILLVVLPPAVRRFRASSPAGSRSGPPFGGLHWRSPPSWPLLARAGATLILPAVVVVPVVITCWWSDLLDCLAHLFTGFTGPAPWVVYSLWLIGLAFQYGLWRYKRGSGRDKELGEVGWSVGFYFVMVLVVFLSVVLLSIGE